tara:strand:+ start:190 stop:444 length:255 start_codon:yes stop_codon:yes gene_type:complete
MSAQDIQQDKLKLISWISQSQDFSLLQKLKNIFEEEAVVAFSTDGKPLTLKQYNQALEKAEKDIKNGRVNSTEELRKKVASWKK